MKKRDVRSMLLAVVISLTMIGAQAAPVPAADLAMGTTAVEAEENEDPAGVEVTAPEHAEGTDLTEGTGDENGAGGSEAGSGDGNTATDAGSGEENADTGSGADPGNADPGSGSDSGNVDTGSGSDSGNTDTAGSEPGSGDENDVPDGDSSGQQGEEGTSSPVAGDGEGTGSGQEGSTDDITDLAPADVPPTEEPTGTPTPAPVKLAAPALKAIANMSGGVRMTWKRVSGAVTYRVYRKQGSGGWKKLCDTQELWVLDQSAVSGVNYSYTVRCLKVGTTYTASDYDQTGLSILRLAEPDPAVANTTGGVRIRWKAVPGADKYYVYRLKDNGDWKQIANTEELVFVDTTRSSGRTAVYTVRALGTNADGSSCRSTYLDTGRSIVYLDRPAVKVTVQGAKVTVSWDAVPGATKYLVMRRASGKGKWKRVASVTETTCVDTNVKAGDVWQYTVRCSAPSFSAYDPRTAKVTIMALPEMEELVNTAEGVTISWKSVKGATAYRLYRKVGKAKWKKLADVTGLSYVDKTAPTGSGIYYRVRGKSEAGLGVITSDYKSVTRIAWNSNWTYASNSKIHTGIAAIYRAPKAVRKGIVVCLNAGHGTRGGSGVKTYCHPDGTPKVTGGTTGAGAIYAYAVSTGTDMKDGSSEASANLKVVMIAKKVLLEKGYDVLMIREGDDVQLDNVARTLMANAYADCHISIHYDDSTNDKGAFYMSVPNISSYRNMEPVKSHWRQHTALGEAVISGLRGAGVKIFSSGAMDSDLTQTSYSTIPSIDLEVGDEGSPLNDTVRGKIAAGMAAGLDKYFQ